MNTTLFLDLEGTVIKSWSYRHLFLSDNLLSIKEAIAQYNETYPQFKINALGLFSYAIKDSEDLDVFKTEIQGHLEQVLGLKFQNTCLFTCQDFERAFKALSRITFIQPGDFIDFMGSKDYIFLRIMPSLLPSSIGTVILVDDIVQDLDHLHKSKNIKLSTRLIRKGLSFI